jgi:hypothetical protein
LLMIYYRPERARQNIWQYDHVRIYGRDYFDKLEALVLRLLKRITLTKSLLN